MRRRRRHGRGHGILVWLVIGVFKLTYILGYTMIGFLIELLKPQCQCQSQLSRVNTSVQQNCNEEIEQIANQDVIDALDQEIEVLRNFRENLLFQAQKTNISATQAAKLQKQAAAVYTRMMKLNEQVLKRRAKEEN